MKYIFEFVLITIILFFVWNILKRIFLTTFYQFPPKNNNDSNNSRQNQSQNKEKQGLNWDAEDAEFEEVKEEEKLKK